MNPEKVFRKYDIRAIINQDLMMDEITDLARAICTYFLELDPTLKELVLGMDARTHSPEIQELFIRGAQASGFSLTLIDVCPTPILYFACQQLQAQAGVMITASHNPKEYNGFKIIFKQQPLSEQELKKIEHIYQTKTFKATEQESSIKHYSIIPNYVDFLAEQFKHLQGMALSAVIDCANGAAGTVLPHLVHAMGWHNVELLFAEPDGSFPHHQPDPSKEKNLLVLKEKITAQQCVGLAFDGDCDRFAAMDQHGSLIPGDELLYMFSYQLPAGSLIVADIKCSQGLINGAQQRGITTTYAQTGCAFIKEKMKRLHALLGGELSGHFCFLDRYYGFDDGIYAMMRFIELLADHSLDFYRSAYPRSVATPEMRIPYEHPELTQQLALIATRFHDYPDAQVTTIDGIRVDTAYGWGIIRSSNTEPLLSIRFEGTSEKELCAIQDLFYTVIGPVLGNNLVQEIKNHVRI